MAEKEITLLKQLVARLDEDKFDLDAWKNRTEIFLERIFGKDSPKLKMIQNLSYDYSSWSLRDTYAGGSAKDPVRIQAREIMEAVITELETLGLPQEKQDLSKVRELLEDELTGRQMREIDDLLQYDDDDKIQKIASILEPVGIENLAVIIAKLLSS